jgi:sulfate permease, SulP family
LILLLWPFVQKQIKALAKIPASLLALLMGLGIEEIWHLQVEVVGHIPTGVPQLHIPEFGQFFEFFWPALSIAGLVIVDSLLTCIVADNITGEKHNSNRETFGQGLANLFSSLLGGLPTATSTVGTVTNYQTGGRTPLAAVVQSLILLALVLGLGPLVEHIPMACLAAILFKVGLNILDYKILSIFHRLPLTDMLVFSVVLVVTLVEDLLVAMAVGLVFAFFRFIQEISVTYQHNAHLLTEIKHEKSIAIADNKIKVLKPNGPLFFGSVEPLNEVYRKAKEHDVLIIDLDMVSFIDLSGAYAIHDLALWAERQGRRVVISGGEAKIVKILERVNVIDEKRKREYFANIEDAISYSQVAELMNIIDHEVETTMILRSS